MFVKRFLVAVAMTCLLCAGCGAEPPKTGRVIEKQFQAAYVETGSTLTCMAYGQYGCTAWIPIPYTIEHPDKWFFLLENCDKVKKNGEPKCFKGYRQVSSLTFEQFVEGDQFHGEQSNV